MGKKNLTQKCLKDNTIIHTDIIKEATAKFPGYNKVTQLEQYIALQANIFAVARNRKTAETAKAKHGLAKLLLNVNVITKQSLN